ncbi:MAG: hypothetical protein FJ088_14035, partial [Deltaproteobacteria bacterium]|nr:hypothetical protein [Deltaproteobacteria bacterium]
RDYWTYDAFHTRDVVRQTVIDIMQFIRVLRNCDGKNSADLDVNNDGKNEAMCDFDGDGAVDIGGLDNNYSAWGVSLGGIVTGVLAGIEAALSSAAVISGGGGLADVAIRSTQTGVPQMAVLPIMGAMILGEQDEDRTSLSFYIPNFSDYRKVKFAVVPQVSEGDVIRVSNIDTAEEKTVIAGKNGTFRIQIQADALKATEIRAFLKFDPTAEEFEPTRVADTIGSSLIPRLGDQITIEISDGGGVTKAFVDKFGMDVQANGIIYAENAPLVNIYEGYGFFRQSPDFRRFVGIAQTILEAGDPANWAPHYFSEPVSFPESDPSAAPGVNAYILNTIGDTNVNIATGVSLARAAGLIDYMNPDGKYGGSTQMDVLIDNYVVEGVSHLRRWSVSKGGPNLYSPETLEITDEIFFDPDYLSEGKDGFHAPKLDPPLRLSK